HVLKMAAFVGNGAGIKILDLADRPRQAAERRHLGAARMLLRPHALEFRVAIDVGPRGPLPASAQTGQPALEIKKERVALLLAVVADIDAGGALLVDDAPHRLLAGLRDLSSVRRLAGSAHGVKPRQFPRPRQAAGVGGENPRSAALHGFLLRGP